MCCVAIAIYLYVMFNGSKSIPSIKMKTNFDQDMVKLICKFLLLQENLIRDDCLIRDFFIVIYTLIFETLLMGIYVYMIGNIKHRFIIENIISSRFTADVTLPRSRDSYMPRSVYNLKKCLVQ